MAGASGWKRQSDTERRGRGGAASAHTPVRSGESTAPPRGRWVGATRVALGGHPTSPSLRARPRTPRAGHPPARRGQGASQLRTSPWRGVLWRWRRRGNTQRTPRRRRGGRALGPQRSPLPCSGTVAPTLSGAHTRARFPPPCPAAPRSFSPLLAVQGRVGLRGASGAALAPRLLLRGGSVPPTGRLRSSRRPRCPRRRS